METDSNILELDEIHTYYEESHILQGVSLKVRQGESIAVLGRNGAGKTTLLRSIIGFNRPRRGSVTFKGRDITHFSPYRIARLGIGLVPQGRRVFSSLSVEENLGIAARKQEPQGWTASDILKYFPRLKDRLRSRAKTLSGGEQQMLACGRALVGNPQLIMMDEPSEGLSPLLVKELGRVIGEIRQRGVTLVLVEQNYRFALGLVDRVCLMSRGRIVYESDPASLSSNEEIRARYLGV